MMHFEGIIVQGWCCTLFWGILFEVLAFLFIDLKDKQLVFTRLGYTGSSMKRVLNKAVRTRLL